MVRHESHHRVRETAEQYLVDFVAHNNLINWSADIGAYLLEPARELLK